MTTEQPRVELKSLDREALIRFVVEELGARPADGLRIFKQIWQVGARSFDEMEEWGDDLSGFDLIVALSPASQRRALDLTRHYHLEIEYWPIMDPTGIGQTREEHLSRYRAARDQIRDKMIERFGPPTA